MRNQKLKNNIILQYTIVSFVTTLVIALFMILLMVERIQTQLVLAHGDFYKEFISAIPENYKEILPYFDVHEELHNHDADKDIEHSEDSHLGQWEHFKKDLMQYPFIQMVRLWNVQNEVVWGYPEILHHDDHFYPAAQAPFRDALNFRIDYREPELIISYFIPLRFENKKIATAEIVIKNNSLKINIEESRKSFAVFTFIGGFIFYVSLFLLFFRVYMNQKKALLRLDKSQTLTIRTMSLLAELKDNDTGEHIQRTSEYCRILAQRLKNNSSYKEYISDEYIKDLERSAPLHDIGKVGIPEKILLKPGKLTDAEYEIMKKHSEYGANVLLRATESLEFRSFFEIGYQIVLHHHENWDGSGYPHGLAGKVIPLSARIMAVADVYDALTTERPYKRAFAHDEAMEIIVRDKAKKFDPELIDILLEIEEEFRQISEEKI